ncbi:tetratricopeptide repeat protein [Janthinobacterium sp. GB4P2]|uniref:tetratricopeptide repeat protein n=1 Tax=Janthinobacterium sp. GB4P2 TaxID=3424189 RepID=UPI003F247B41
MKRASSLITTVITPKHSSNSTRPRARAILPASLYYQGHGVEQNLPKAVELFTAAAQAGFPPSLANLALMYASGDGVVQDMAQSLA